MTTRPNWIRVDDHFDSDYENDTFDFKRVPGQFGKQSILPMEEDTELTNDPAEEYDDGSERSAHSDAEVMSEDEQSPAMPGSLPPANRLLLSPTVPSMKALVPGTPGKPLLDLEGDWAEQLQRTISPRKQNRDVLREAQSKILLDKAFSPIKPKAAPQVNFKSSIDIMNSMFKPASSKKSAHAVEPDFEFPYSKRSKTFHPDGNMTEDELRWHDSFKPHFTNDGRVIYRTSTPSRDQTWSELPVAREGPSAVVMGRQTKTKYFNLDAALTASEVVLSESIPSVKHYATPFSQAASMIKNEKVETVYGLAHVLFDSYDDQFTRGLTKPQQKQFMPRIRRDRLAQFLTARNSEKVPAESQMNPLRKAVLLLTAHDIQGAVDELKTGMNYRIALLVAQLDGADKTFMDDMQHQIDAWRGQKSLSEFDLDMRALYEICSGNVGICEGREGRTIPVEDRAEAFHLSARYGLDWLQCFALGLFYGKNEKDNPEGISTIEDAVREYRARCDRGEEDVKPPADDVLWSLLKLYAATRGQDLEAPSFPAALEGLGSPWDHSALFTLHHTITANLAVNIDVEKANELAATLASELSNGGDIASAIYALIHLSDASMRQSQIQDLLDRFGSRLPGPDTATSDEGIQLWQRLTIDLKIPSSWIYMSKARYAASPTNKGGDNIAELRFLVAAGAWPEAHECLLQRVAPAFVIDQDWAGLLDMCKLFGDDPSARVEGWYEGGDSYAAFAQLMSGAIAKSDSAFLSDLRKRLVLLGQRRSSKEVQVHLGRLSRHELEAHVAVQLMSNEFAKLRDSGFEVGTLRELIELTVTGEVRGWLEMFRAAELPPASGAGATSTTTTSRRRGARGQGLGIQSQAQARTQDKDQDEEMESVDTDDKTA